jgi:hypothetical protein
LVTWKVYVGVLFGHFDLNLGASTYIKRGGEGLAGHHNTTMAAPLKAALAGAPSPKP